MRKKFIEIFKSIPQYTVTGDDIMRPIIGITCGNIGSSPRFALSADYVRAVESVGGTPVVLPVLRDEAGVERLVSLVDGVLLSGGGDLDPTVYGEEPLPQNGSIDPERDWFELLLTRKVLARGLPVLGICRGMQVLNVAAGGTVCQDISLEIERPLKHFQDAPRWYPTHSIEVVENTRLARILGERKLKVNSFHHQMVGRRAAGFCVSALSPDGVIEAIESGEGGFVIGVQFHPENLFRRPEFKRIFSALVEEAAVLSKKKRLEG